MRKGQRDEIPELTRKVIAGAGSVAKAIEALSQDDSIDACDFMAKYLSVSKSDRQRLALEDFVAASGLSARRFIEVLTGALMQQCQDVSKMMVAVAQPKVLASIVKAATDRVPITAYNREEGITEIVGYTNGDTKAMEIFAKGTGFLPTPKGAVTNISLNQQNNAQGSSEDEDNGPDDLQSMDEFLMEMQDVLRPAALPAPSVQVPVIMSDIEYLDVEV